MTEKAMMEAIREVHADLELVAECIKRKQWGTATTDLGRATLYMNHLANALIEERQK